MAQLISQLEAGDLESFFIDFSLIFLYFSMLFTSFQLVRSKISPHFGIYVTFTSASHLPLVTFRRLRSRPREESRGARLGL